MNKQLVRLEELLGKEDSRIKGISGWNDIPYIGKNNISNILEFARRNVQHLFAQGESRSTLRELIPGIKQLEQYYAEIDTVRPILPRLRIESFRKDEKVAVYVGDTPGVTATESWVNGTIINIQKAHKSEFSNGSHSAGFYWEITLRSDRKIFTNENHLTFSTSEPRVIPLKEFGYLKEALVENTQFVHIYSENANREWEPIWCLERKISSSGTKMDMYTFLQR